MESRTLRFWRFWAAFSLKRAWPLTVLGTVLFVVLTRRWSPFG